MKDVISVSPDVYIAPMKYQNTPGVTGNSPAQQLMGRHFSTMSPKTDTAPTPKQSSTCKFRKEPRTIKRKRVHDFNRHHPIRNLCSLQPGQDVLVQDIPCIAKVLSLVQQPWSHINETLAGVIMRSRRHLMTFDLKPSGNTPLFSEDINAEPMGSLHQKSSRINSHRTWSRSP